MLDQNRISIGKLRLAFALSLNDTKELVYALPCEAVFPFVIWERIYEESWKERSSRLAQQFNVSLTFPEPQNYGDILNDNKDSLYNFLTDLAPLVSIEFLLRPFSRLFQTVYGELSQSHTSTLIEMSREFFTCALGIFNTKDARYSDDTIYSKEFAEYTKTLLLHTSADLRFQDIFPDTILVDKKLAIKHLVSCGYPLHEEVKGISRVLYEHIISEILYSPVNCVVDTPSPTLIEPSPKIVMQSAPMPETEKEFEKAPETEIQAPKNTVLVPFHLWEGKSAQFVRDSMRQENYHDTVIAHVLFAWCKINKTQVGRLLIGENKEDSTCRKACNDLLLKASRMDISAC